MLLSGLSQYILSLANICNLSQSNSNSTLELKGSNVGFFQLMQTERGSNTSCIFQQR